MQKPLNIDIIAYFTKKRKPHTYNRKESSAKSRATLSIVLRFFGDSSLVASPPITRADQPLTFYHIQMSCQFTPLEYLNSSPFFPAKSSDGS